jgi:tripeptidyl-peptidase-1
MTRVTPLLRYVLCLPQGWWLPRHVIPQGALNTQYIVSLTSPTPVIYYVTNGTQNFTADKDTTSNTNEPYMDWLQFMLKEDTVPQTIISPFGDDEQTVPPDYANSVCNLFAQLGSRGASVLFPSGDQGVAGTGGSCVSNNGTNSPAFIPLFPASCEWFSFPISQ